MDRREIEELIHKSKELEKKLQSPEVLSNPQELIRLSQEHKEMKEIVKEAESWLKIEEEISSVNEILKKEEDRELVDLAREELKSLYDKKGEIERKLLKLMIPRDPKLERNCIVEIRAGTGGEEAGLFARDLFKMYNKYCEKMGWRVYLSDSHTSSLGGFKEVIFIVEGKGAYGKFRFESGVHRVQRIPQTESGGRIHTSSASVVVLPESPPEEVEIDPNELKIETFRAGGPGGQHVNVTDSAVRITHKPTGIVVACQDERSQHKNKTKAMRILRSRLSDYIERERMKEITNIRKTFIGTGDRSEKIRTYNFPQNRVTDHRINLTLYNLDRVMEGALEEIIKNLEEEEERKAIESIANSE